MLHTTTGRDGTRRAACANARSLSGVRRHVLSGILGQHPVRAGTRVRHMCGGLDLLYPRAAGHRRMPPAGLAAAATTGGNSTHTASAHAAAGRTAAARRGGARGTDLSAQVPPGRRHVLQPERRRLPLLRQIVGQMSADRWFVQRRRGFSMLSGADRWRRLYSAASTTGGAADRRRGGRSRSPRRCGVLALACYPGRRNSRRDHLCHRRGASGRVLERQRLCCWPILWDRRGPGNVC